MDLHIVIPDLRLLEVHKINVNWTESRIEKILFHFNLCLHLSCILSSSFALSWPLFFFTKVSVSSSAAVVTVTFTLTSASFSYLFSNLVPPPFFNSVTRKLSQSWWKSFSGACFAGTGGIEQGQEQAREQDKEMERPWSTEAWLFVYTAWLLVPDMRRGWRG